MDKEYNWRNNDRRKPPPVANMGQIIQAVLIAGITAVMIHIFSIPKLEERIDDLARSVGRIRDEQIRLRNDLYQPRTTNKLSTFEPVAEGKQ